MMNYKLSVWHESLLGVNLYCCYGGSSVAGVRYGKAPAEVALGGNIQSN